MLGLGGGGGVLVGRALMDIAMPLGLDVFGA